MVKYKKLISTDNTNELTDGEFINSLTIPRLTTAQRDGMTAVVGNIIFNTSASEFQYYDGSSWLTVTTGAGGTTYVTISGVQTILSDKNFQNINLVSGKTYKINNIDTLTPSAVGGSSADFIVGQNLRTTATGLRIGDVSAPTSAIDVVQTNPSMQMTGTGTSTIFMKGATENVYDFGFSNAKMSMATGTGKVQFKDNIQQQVEIDMLNARLAVGPGASTKNKIRANFNSGANVDHAVQLPRMDNTGQGLFTTAIGADPTYPGSIWFNTTDNELRCLFNGNVVNNIHHGNTTNINATQIANGAVNDTEYQHLNGVTSNIQTQLNNTVTLDAVGTFTNKTISADSNTITDIDNDEIKVGANIDVTKLGTGIISNTEFNYLNNVTSDIQTQLNNRVDKVSTETIGGVKTFTNNVNTTGQYSINGTPVLSSTTLGSNIVNSSLSSINPAGNNLSVNNSDISINQAYKLKIEGFDILQQDRLLLKSGTNNTPQIKAEGANASSGKLQFLNNSGVQCGFYTNNTCILEWDYNVNITDNTKSFNIGGVPKLSNTTLGSTIINSSIQNSSSDEFNILGQTATDAFLNVQRSTGEQAILKSTISGTVLANNTKDLITLNNSKAELGTGLNMDIKTSQTYQINSVPVLSADTLQSPVINSSLQNTTPVTNIFTVNTADIRIDKGRHIKTQSTNSLYFNRYPLQFQFENGGFSTNSSTFQVIASFLWRDMHSYETVYINRDTTNNSAEFELYSVSTASSLLIIPVTGGIQYTTAQSAIPVQNTDFQLVELRWRKTAGSGAPVIYNVMLE